MSLSLSDRRMLRRIGKALRRDDPRLASMLTTFAPLTNSEARPGREQVPRRQPDAGQRCIWLPPEPAADHPCRSDSTSGTAATPGAAGKHPPTEVPPDRPAGSSHP